MLCDQWVDKLAFLLIRLVCLAFAVFFDLSCFGLDWVDCLLNVFSCYQNVCDNKELDCSYPRFLWTEWQQWHLSRPGTHTHSLSHSCFFVRAIKNACDSKELACSSPRIMWREQQHWDPAPPPLSLVLLFRFWSGYQKTCDSSELEGSFPRLVLSEVPFVLSDLLSSLSLAWFDKQPI